MKRIAAPVAPQKSAVRHAEQIQTADHQRAVNRVDDSLEKKLTSDARCRLVDGLGRHRQLAVAEQTDQPVAQFLALQQHEQHERHHEARRAEGLDQRSEPGNRRHASRVRIRDDQRLGHRSRRSLHGAEVPLNLLERLFDLLNRSPRPHAADVVDLRADVRTIGGKLVAHAGHLAIHTIPGQA